MNKKTKENSLNEVNVIKILLRYILALILALILYYSPVIYEILLNLTIAPINWSLNLFYNSIITGSSLIIEDKTIELIPACIAVSAYILLLIINLTTPMCLNSRIKSLIFSFAALLILNILRIFLLSVLFVEGFIFFDIIHKIFWYFLSTILVVLIWFSSVAIFKIKGIPVYSDIKLIIENINKQ